MLAYLFGGVVGLDQKFKRIPMITSNKLVAKKNHTKGAAHAAPFAWSGVQRVYTYLKKSPHPPQQVWLF